MANIFLFFQRPKSTQVIRRVGSELSSMVLDATLKEVFTATAEPTQHPIEKGADITDHVIVKPNGLSISGIISETPLGDFPGSLVRAAGASVGSKIGDSLGRFGNIGGLLGALGGGALGKTIASSLFKSKDRILQAAVEEFVKIRDARQAVNIQTGLRFYEHYVLTSFTASRDDKTGGSIKVDLEFKEVLVAENRVSIVAIPKVKGALSKTDAGRQSGADAAGDKASKGASILKKIFGGSQ